MKGHAVRGEEGRPRGGASMQTEDTIDLSIPT